MSSAAKYIFMAEDQVEQNTSFEKPSYMVQDDVVTVVLTADNHLGYTAFGQQPRKREELQQRLRRAFQEATDFAVGQGVDFFVQAGDLFHTPVPDERDRSFVAACLAQLREAGVHTFVVGGVHDTPAESAGYLLRSSRLTGGKREDAVSLRGDVGDPVWGTGNAVWGVGTVGTEKCGDEAALAPQMSYAGLGALHYFAPSSSELEPVLVKVRKELVGVCGLGVVAGQVGNPLTQVRVQSDIERATLPLLLLHAPIEGVTNGSSLLDGRAQVSRASIEEQCSFRYILAGYDHGYQHVRIGQSDVIVAGAAQHFDFRSPEHKPGFVFVGLAADGLRWSTHIPVESLSMRRLLISVEDLWLNETAMEQSSPTEAILARLRPFCSAPIRPDYACPPDRVADASASTFGQAGRAETEETMVQLRLVGRLTREQYHQLDLNGLRRYGEQYCFALAIDDSELEIVSMVAAEISGGKAEGQESSEEIERLSPREELMALVDEWIAESLDEQEKQALCATKEDLLVAFDQIQRSKYA